MMVRVVAPGPMTTVQDLGRWGHQALGIPVSGAMDTWSHRAANQLVGNPPEAATLEVTLAGPTLEFSAGTTIAVGGARFLLEVEGQAAPSGRAVSLSPGGRLAFGALTTGARAYVAVAGGFELPRVFGSRSTDLASHFGGLEGRPLRTGDSLNVGVASGAARPGRKLRPPFPLPRGGAVLRVLCQPEADASLYPRLFGQRFQLGPTSNRMGYRLSGPSLASADPAGGLSAATPVGTIQVPPSGDPILLMADRQTTGGYPAPATVISADIGVAAQLAPGDWVEFAPCSYADARAALAAREDAIRHQMNGAV